MNKKYLTMIIIGSIILVIGIIVTIILLKNKDNDSNNKIEPIEVSVIEKITPLKDGNSSDAVELIKSNIVKVINKIDDNNSIIGTGFFDESGYLVTNSHLVDIKGNITIQYYDGTISNAQLFSNDITSDIALLAVESPNVKAMYYGETLSLKVTDDVYAVGYPYALEGEASVSKGVLSARRSAGTVGFLQSDISLNTGNSGGPLINDKAELLGINTYATSNASIGISISSESLQEIIKGLIDNPKVNYLENERPTNALSVVLNEIGYDTSDLYEEDKYINKNNDNEDKIYHDEGNGKNHQNSGNNDNNKDNNNYVPSKDYSINMNNNKSYPAEKDLSKDPRAYANIGSDLTNCTVDLSKVDRSKSGTYEIEIKCDQNSAKGNINILGPVPPNKIDIPEIVMDETKNNVTSIDQVSGIIWYYPGYADACQMFSYKIDVFDWTSLRMSHTGRLQANYGGGGQYYTFEEMIESVKLWRQGNFLVVTTGGTSFTLTSIKGTGYYTNQQNDCSLYNY